jgi:hypothetical protein
MLQSWLSQFAHDTKVQAIILLLIADFVLGVAAALKKGTFRFSYVADLLKNDVLGKVLPYFAFYVLALVAGNFKIVIPGLDFGLIAGAAYALVVAALGGSVLSSISELGFSTGSATGKLQTALFAKEKPQVGEVAAIPTKAP